ncbi:MAG: HAMP domain-containing sensor histidine kinase [Candidatus Baltobacteraceae bacterium]
MIPGVCYGLFLLVWILDLLTPQAFVVSILLSGPIALSTLALQTRLTLQLMIFAEIGNVIAGYVNGAQAGYAWDAVALGNRAISAAAFALVGALTIRAQTNARRAGEAGERERAAERERQLRVAMDHVRASLNVELVMRSAVREAANLTNAPRVTLGVRASTLELPDSYEMLSGDADVTVRRAQLSPAISSFAERARESGRIVTVDLDDPLGRMVGENAFVSAFEVDGLEFILTIGWGAAAPSAQEREVVQAFVDNLSVALVHARLFIRLSEQNVQITEQRNTLQARGDIIRDIVYALAHDLRTPLTAADVTMRQALRGLYGTLPDRYREILKTSVASNAEIQGLVETLLLVARYEAGEDSQVKRVESVGPLIERIASELRPLSEAASIRLETVFLERGAAVVVDGAEVRRAVINLVANAIEATPANGCIKIVVSTKGDSVLIEVLDDGYGVPSERRPSLFQRFGGTRVGGGTGLGLYIVRRIAEKYGGRAGYEPRNPAGSRFFFELPKAEKIV